MWMRIAAFLMLGMIAPASRAEAPDLQLVDQYLQTFDRFAEGDESLVPQMKAAWPGAQAQLVGALRARDPRAPSRLVLLMLLQIGGSVPIESDIGRAWREYVGIDFPVHDTKSAPVYFVSDFYFWWTENRSEKHDIPLLAQWVERDFAKESVLPMYRRWKFEARK
jgi:hypothetical protein